MKISETRAQSLVRGTSTQVALVLIVSLLLWASGAPMFLDHAHASNLSSVSDTLTNSANGMFSGHTIEYVNATTTTAGQTINIQLDPDTHAFTELGDAATSSHFSLQYNNGATTSIAIVSSCSASPQALVVASTTWGSINYTL